MGIEGDLLDLAQGEYRLFQQYGEDFGRKITIDSWLFAEW
jgi:hypothetical protein